MEYVKEHGVVTFLCAVRPALTPEEWRSLPIPGPAAGGGSAPARIGEELPAGVSMVMLRRDVTKLLAVTDAQLGALEAAVGLSRAPDTISIKVLKLWPALAKAAQPVASFAAATHTGIDAARALLASQGAVVFRLSEVDCVLAAAADAVRDRFVSLGELCATAVRLPLPHLQYAVARAIGWSVEAACPASHGDAAAAAALPMWMVRDGAAARVRHWLQPLSDVVSNHHIDTESDAGRRTVNLCAKALAPSVCRVLGTGTVACPLQLCVADEDAAGREWLALNLVPYDYALWLAHHGLPAADADHWRTVLGPDVVQPSPHIDRLHYIPIDAKALAERTFGKSRA